MRKDERGLAGKTVVLILVAVIIGAAIGVGLVSVFSDNGGRKPRAGHSGGKGSKPAPVTIPASDFDQNTWGYLGCSNTHDTIFGYGADPQSKHLFWPFEAFPTEGMTVRDWTNAADRHWQRFDQAKQRFDGGGDPPVIWVQLCENLNPSDSNFSGPSDFGQVQQMLSLLKQHSPGSKIFISPLQAYQPADLCSVMGPNGEAIPELTDLANQAVDAGLAFPGPGTDDIPNLGPLTSDLVVSDGCHPSGGPHGPGNGALVLGQQLAKFFDNLPQG